MISSRKMYYRQSAPCAWLMSVDEESRLSERLSPSYRASPCLGAPHLTARDRRRPPAGPSTRLASARFEHGRIPSRAVNCFSISMLLVLRNKYRIPVAKHKNNALKNQAS